MVVIDLDNNGFSDLLLTRTDGIYWYKNDGNHFVKIKLNIPVSHDSTPLSLAITDLNKDGWADLFIAGYTPREQITGYTTFNDKTYGGHQQLWLNKGDNTFTDITTSAGLDYRHNTFQAVFVDLNDDLEADLVVAHDTGEVRIYKNNGDLTFSLQPNPSTGKFAYPMGIAVADYDNDGKIDLAFSNVGNMGPLNKTVRGDLREDQDFNAKMIVLHNNGDFSFTDTSKETHLADYEFGWGLIWEDFNNDQLTDLVLAQNYIQFPPHALFPLPGRFLLQGDDHVFSAYGKISGLSNRAFGVSPLFADFNQDGALDLVYVNVGGPSKAFLNSKNKNHFIDVELPDTVEYLGAKVIVKSKSGENFIKYFLSGEGLLSDSSHLLHFGLGTITDLSSVSIKTLTGKTIPLTGNIDGVWRLE